MLYKYEHLYIFAIVFYIFWLSFNRIILYIYYKIIYQPEKKFNEENNVKTFSLIKILIINKNLKQCKKPKLFYYLSE